MKKAFMVWVVVLVTVSAAGPAGASGYRSFVSLTGGANHIWNPLADAILSVFEYDSKTGYGGSLGYGTRLGRESHFVLYGCYAYDQLRVEDEEREVDSVALNQVRANLRYYIGHVSDGPAVYIGLGPDLMFDQDDVGVNVNLSLGGDFPVGHGWSILVDGTVDAVLAYGHVGVAYWFK